LLAIHHLEAACSEVCIGRIVLIGKHTIRNIRDQRKEEKCPTQRIRQCFLELIPFKVLIAHTLIVRANALNRQNTIFFAQPPAVHLIVRYNPEKQEAKSNCQKACDEEDDFPGLDGSSGFAASDCYAVCETAAENLTAMC
jgi:hypothetical protein